MSEKKETTGQSGRAIESVDITEDSVTITSVEFSSEAPVRVIQSYFVANGKLIPAPPLYGTFKAEEYVFHVIKVP